MAQAKRLSGLHPLAYMGVEPTAPPLLVIQTRQPTTEDSKNFNLGTIWIYRTSGADEIWMLVDLAGNVATWVQLYPGAGSGASQFPCDVGVANEAGGILNVLGSTHIATQGVGNNILVEFNNGSNGQVLIGGGVEALWKNITSSGGTITVTNGANSINLETVGGQGVDNVITDSGIATPTATGDLTIAGGELINTAGAASTATVNLNRGTDGQIIIGATGAPSAYANLTSTGGSITITNGMNSINLEATGVGTTGSFFAYQNARLSGATNVGGGTVGAVITGIGEDTILTVDYDVSSAFFPGDGAGTGAYYTAPVSGKYVFHVLLSVAPVTNPIPGATGCGEPYLFLEETSAAYGCGQATSFSNNINGTRAGRKTTMATFQINMGIGDVVEFNFSTVPKTYPSVGCFIVGKETDYALEYGTSISGFLLG